MKAKPIIQWAGGKRQLIPHILPLVPDKIDAYYEPFLGGGALFFELASRAAFDGALIRDANQELVNLYRELRRDAAGVMHYINVMESNGFSRESYNKIRATYPTSPEAAAARTIYLNKCGFNGLYRQNKAGKFNVPWGKKEHVNVYDRETMLAASRALKLATISCGDFATLTNLRPPKPGDFVYLDPPYVPVSKTSNFTSYTADGFTPKDQVRVRDVFNQCAHSGVAVVASNSDTPLVRDLYGGHDIISVQARRNINSKGSGRGPVGEVLIYANTERREMR